MDANLNQPTPLKDMHECVSSWFLGPRAENFDLLKEIFAGVLDEHRRVREEYHPEDGTFITNSIHESKTFQENVDLLRSEIDTVSRLLNEYSVPFFSPRYMGHMIWETSLPALAGWLCTLLFNQNNVTFEASPLTTLVEIEVGNQLCSMLGYSKGDENLSESWGHIASDGTLANMESMWAARNLKYYPLSVHAAMRSGRLAFIADKFKVTTADKPNEPQLFKDLTTWQLLNLPPPVILGMGDQLHLQFGITPTFLSNAISPYLVQSKGKEDLLKNYGIEHPPQCFFSSTKHYSWPKAAALVGIGSDNCINIPVDSDARIDITKLDALLQACLDKKQAVYSVVAIIGSTEEGTVDPLDRVVELREKYAKKGLTFIVHADAAWGGYFASMIRDPPEGLNNRYDDQEDEEGSRDFVPAITMREYSVRQFRALARADSITIDPHKAGYVPYPAGGLCYRDGRMRFLLTWTAPYLHDSDNGESIGVYGIEGSKPGAAAIACYLHNTVVGLHKLGHGALLGEVSFTCRRFSAHWAAMSDDTTDFIVVPFNKFTREADGPSGIAEEKAFIRAHILGKSNQAIVKNPAALDEICALGSDLNINVFTCNFRDANGRVNTDVEEANYLNNRIFERLSLTSVGERPEEIPIFLTATVFDRKDYGECLDEYKRRLGLETESKQPLFVLRHVVMSPFQGAGNFVEDICKMFQKTLEEEIANVVERNTVSPQIHEFVLQGTNHPYLVYRPLFHHANGRQQLILSVGDIEKGPWAKVKDAMAKHPDAVFKMQTSSETTIDHILGGCRSCGDASFHGDITGPGIDLKSVNLSKVKVIKQRTLESAYRDEDYPTESVPFYLYGSHGEVHVDHMLVIAPNAQISSARVHLDAQPPLSDAHLARGVIAHIEVPEDALQPIEAEHPFMPKTTFRVTIREDAHDVKAHGPGLAKGGRELARGTLTFGDAVFTDVDRLNTQDFASDARASDYTSSVASKQVKAEWARVVQERLGLQPSGGKVVAPMPKTDGQTGHVGGGLVYDVVKAGGEVVQGTVQAGGSVAQGILKGGGDVVGGVRKAGQTIFGGLRV
ncbi:hypothetical protein EV714DRAFT_252348, partial [Schizophyllum commune]